MLLSERSEGISQMTDSDSDRDDQDCDKTETKPTFFKLSLLHNSPRETNSVCIMTSQDDRVCKGKS